MFSPINWKKLKHAQEARLFTEEEMQMLVPTPPVVVVFLCMQMLAVALLVE